MEGNSIRSTERITGVHRDTILALIVKAGERCEKLLAEKIAGLKVRDVQCDELWGYVKEKSKGGICKGVDKLGDAYCFVAIERNTKMILAWHLGRCLDTRPEAHSCTTSCATAKFLSRGQNTQIFTNSMNQWTQ